MEKIFVESINNSNISFNNDEEIIVFDEYCTSGIKCPKDIVFTDITAFNLKMNWKFDNNFNMIYLDDLDESKIKFRVEIRSKKENDQFIQVYEGNQTNCLIDNLVLDTTYEVRIASL